MKFVIFAGTPGSGKTSIVKHIVKELKSDFKLYFAKFDCLKTSDDEVISKKYRIPTVKKLAGELCPDHYTALEIPKLIKENQDRDIIILETAGLCLRCSPYIKEGLGINVLDITSGNPSRYGPILTDADVVAVSKGDLISQAEREIFRAEILKVNPKVSFSISDPYEPAEDFFGASGLQAWGIAHTFKKNEDIKRYEEIHQHSRNQDALRKQGLEQMASVVNFNVITIEPLKFRYLNLRKGFRNVTWEREG